MCRRLFRARDLVDERSGEKRIELHARRAAIALSAVRPALITDFFDLRPGAIIRDLGLRKPIYRKTAAYGHFGRDDIEFPWERIDKAEALKSAAGL